MNDEGEAEVLSERDEDEGQGGGATGIGRKRRGGER